MSSSSHIYVCLWLSLSRLLSNITTPPPPYSSLYSPLPLSSSSLLSRQAGNRFFWLCIPAFNNTRAWNDQGRGTRVHVLHTIHIPQFIDPQNSYTPSSDNTRLRLGILRGYSCLYNEQDSLLTFGAIYWRDNTKIYSSRSGLTCVL